MEQLKSDCISKLAFLTLNPSTDDKLRLAAERELKVRLKSVEFDFALEHEKNVLETRGYDLNDYLICDNPNMQMFMEIFFKYVHDKDFYHHPLLFSETHICNDCSALNNTTRKIILSELKNIRRRMYDLGNPQIFNDIMSAFAKRLGMDVTMRKGQSFDYFLEESDSFSKFESFEFNSERKMMPFAVLEDFKKYSEEHPLKAKWYVKYAAICGMLNDSILDADLAQNLMIYHEIGKDSKKVNPQKTKLLRQARNGYNVDYEFLEK